MSTRIMLDLETLGTSPGSAILAIGAVHFCEGQIFTNFYQRIDLKSCIEVGLQIDPQTVLWWLKQPDGPRLEISNPGTPIREVLKTFQAWVFGLGEFEGVEVWGNGAAFDNVLLSVAFEKCGILRPWKYSNDRCYRTVKNIFPNSELARDGTHHNALDDARSQAMHLMAMLPNL